MSMKSRNAYRSSAPVQLLLVFGVSFYGPSFVFGQQPPAPGNDTKKPPTAQTHPNNPELWNVEAMMDEAVTQIARRYNLSEPQENYTRLLLKKRTLAFLEVYEKDVRDLLKESIDLRTGAKKPTFEAYMKWAARAAPIYKEAAKAILEGNEEWRAILNDEQKKTHDTDMALMRNNFSQIDNTMEEWRKGNTPVGRDPSLPPAEGTGSSVGNPPGGQQKGMVSPPAIVHKEQEDNWLAYVNLFIQTYGLDEKQANAARDRIHKDIKDQAIRYRQKHKAEFESLEIGMKSGGVAKMKPQEVAIRKSELEKPIREMFIDMDRRLDGLVDSKQRAGADIEKKKLLDRNFETLAGKSREAIAKDKSESELPKLRPVAATTQPAKEQGSIPSGSKREPMSPTSAPAE